MEEARAGRKSLAWFKSKVPEPELDLVNRDGEEETDRQEFPSPLPQPAPMPASTLHLFQDTELFLLLELTA